MRFGMGRLETFRSSIEVDMTPIHYIACDLSRANTIKKMNRDGYAKWKRHEAEAARRREDLKRCRNV